MRRLSASWVVAGGVALLAACGSNPSGGEERRDGGGGGDGGTVACIAGLTALTLDPGTSNVTLTGAAPAPITFTATGRFADGHSETIAGDRLAWTAARSDDTPAGAVDRGVYAPFAGAGGTVTITAGDGCVSGTATVTLFLDV